MPQIMGASMHLLPAGLRVDLRDQHAERLAEPAAGDPR
jgi:hypothetical protein